MPTLAELDALEILDSRGRPTLEATCTLGSGATATAQVPSGASTGAAEALELRDRDPERYAGLGCRRAVANVRGEIREALVGRSFARQEDIDTALLEQDGTASKGRLGANAVLACSLAFARAHAMERAVPLYQHFAEFAGGMTRRLPRPTVNLFSGGKHAGGQVAIQDVLLVPMAATRMDEALAQVSAVFRAAATLVSRKYRSRLLVADEGGLAPEFASTSAMLEDACEAVREAGFRLGTEMALAVDVAASHFYADRGYALDGVELDSNRMIDRLAEWVRGFPIVSVEDGLAEDDWLNWPRLRERLEGRALVLGDDLLCTNPGRIRRAIDTRAANALLLKVNQIGTLTEALDANRLARRAGWEVTISARSGETEDHWLADLATGWGGTHIKIGSITRSERLAKYNRLLAIEAKTGWPLMEPSTGG